MRRSPIHFVFVGNEGAAPGRIAMSETLPTARLAADSHKIAPYSSFNEHFIYFQNEDYDSQHMSPCKRKPKCDGLSFSGS